MPIQATFTADFTKWDAALKNAQANLKTFEVSTNNVKQSLQRMVTGFDGTKLMREAKTAAAAVEAIGGASKLTAAEQRKVNATVTEAIAKYHALGQTAPKELLKLQKETAGVNKAMSGIGSTVLKLGGLFAATFTVGALTRAAKAAIDLGGELTDLSARTGLSTQALQEFRFAGGQVGVSMESITSAVGQMQKRIVGGGDSAVAAFKALGLSVAELRNLNPEDQFAAIAAAVKEIEDPAVRAKLAMDVMGKGALEVMPLLVSNFDELRKKAKDLGIILDDETIRALDEMGDTLDTLAFVGQALIANVLKPLEPHLKGLSEFALSAVGSFKLLSDALTSAQLAFQKILVQAANVKAAMFDMQAAILRTASANVFGLLNTQVAEAERQAEHYRTIAKLLTADIQNQITDGLKPQAEAVKGSTRAFKPLILETDEARKAAEAAAKAIAELRKEITGAKLIASIKQMATAWAGLTKSQKESAPAMAALAKFYDALPKDMAELPPELREIVDEGEKASRAIGALAEDYKSVREEVSKLDAILDKLELSADAEEARQILSEIGTELGLVGRQIDEAFDFGEQLDDTIADIRGVDNAIQAMFEDVDDKDVSFGKKFGANLKKNLLDSVAGIPELITQGILHDASWEDMAIAMASMIGAALGAALGGALAGPAGAQIGAALGSLLGPLLDAIWTTRAEETQERIRVEFGVAISEGLAQAIEDAADRFGGNREAAKLFNLDRIIAEGGGLTTDNLDEMFARFRDVFSLLETGAIGAADAISILDRNFKTFADFVTAGGALASKELLEIIRLSGTASAAVNEFVDAQARSALEGLQTFIDTRGDIATSLAEAQDNLNDLLKKKAPSEEIAKARAEVAKFQAQLAAIPLTAAGAEAFGASLFAIFEQLARDGVPALEIIRQMDPVIASLDEQLKAAGLSGGAAFDSIRNLAALARDEIAGPAFTAIAGLGQALEGLHNSGLLTQETFSGIAEQITATYAGLVAQGKGGADALRLMGGPLQDLWELQQDFGYAVDDATQKLLDEAEAAGIVGDQHRTVQERMLLAMERTAEAAEALTRAFGVDIPSALDETGEAARRTGEELERIPKGVRIKVNYDVERLPNPDRGPGGIVERPERPPGFEGRYYAKGGVVYAQHGMWAPRGTDTVPAMLTPGEVVLPREVVAALRSSATTPAVTVHLTIQAMDGADVERVVRSPDFRRALTSTVSGNVGGVRTDLRTAIGVR